MEVSYQLEKSFLRKVENDKDNSNVRELVSNEQLAEIKKLFPTIPQEFIAYLKEIGSGNFRECQFNVRPFLFNLEEIGLENQYELKPSVWFFGDNYCGDFSGFDLDNEDGFVVEFWHESGELNYTNKSFQSYIREQMLMDENGSDTREKENRAI